MPNPSDEAARIPFVGFNFAVEINVPGVSKKVRTRCVVRSIT